MENDRHGLFPASFKLQCDIVRRVYKLLIHPIYRFVIASDPPALTGKRRDSFLAKYPAFLEALTAVENSTGPRSMLVGLLRAILPDARYFVRQITDYARHFSDADVIEMVTILNLEIRRNPRSQAGTSSNGILFVLYLHASKPTALVIRIKRGDRLDRLNRAKRLFVIRVLNPFTGELITEIRLQNGKRYNLVNLGQYVGCRIEVDAYYVNSLGKPAQIHTTDHIYIPGVFNPNTPITPNNIPPQP